MISLRVTLKLAKQLSGRAKGGISFAHFSGLILSHWSYPLQSCAEELPNKIVLHPPNPAGLHQLSHFFLDLSFQPDPNPLDLQNKLGHICPSVLGFFAPNYLHWPSHRNLWCRRANQSIPVLECHCISLPVRLQESRAESTLMSIMPFEWEAEGK